MMRKNAFTLAEVLITLGIIGVVAAMTIPTLISNTNGAQFKTAYKKALSTLNQAALMNIALEDYDFTALAADTKTGADVDGTENKTMAYILTKRLNSATNITDGYTWPTDGIKYYSEVKCTGAGKPADECTAADEELTLDKTVQASELDDWAIFSFADGTAFAFNPAASNCSAKNDTCVGFIDVNGATNPNTQTVCTKGKEGGTGDDESNGACIVESTGVNDIFPVYFYGQTVEPASDAARAVLFGR